VRPAPALAAVCSLSALAFLGASAQEKPGDEDTRAEHVFKNIQVFKGQPSSEIGPAMAFMTGSLGANCEFCHVRSAEGHWDFAKDDKEEKQTARKMILMTRKINEDNFDGTNVVTCASCHNGRHSPNPVPQLPPPGAAEKRPEGPALTVDEVLAGYEQALGGRAALEAVKSRVFKGSVTSRGKTQPIEIQQGDGRVAITTGDETQAYDGTSAWNSGPHGGGPVEEPELQSLRLAADIHQDLRLKETFPEIKYGGRAKVGEKDAIVLRLDTKKRTSERLFFDPETHLLLRRIVYYTSVLGKLPEQIDYSDYRPVGGAKVAFREEVTVVWGSEVHTFTDVQSNVPLNEKLFQKPASPKEKS
jgi:hypothetical protein